MRTEPASSALLRTGVLCNPLSGRVPRSLHALRGAAAALPDAIYREATSGPEMAAALDEFAAQGIGLLTVIGGDGTVHAALGHLFSHPAITSLPMLTVIPAGTTNMTASDLGSNGNPPALLERLRKQLQHPQQARTRMQAILRVDHAGLQLHGLFFGSGMIAEGVRYFLEQVRGTGFTGEKASAMVMMRSLAKLLCSGAEANRMLLDAELSLDGEPVAERRFLLVFATSLRRLLLGMRPYWGRESAPIHATALSAAPRKLWRRVPRLIVGHGDGLPAEDGYMSRNVNVLELRMAGEFALDGELYRADPARGPVRISAAGPIRVLQI